MKNVTSFTRAFFVAAMLFMAAGLTTTNAQSVIGKTPVAQKYAIANLKAGIGSDNNGVRRSSIYFAGKYKLAEVAQTLVDQFGKENDNSLRVLISLSLYQMGAEEGLQKVLELAAHDDSARVKNMVAQVYNRLKDDLHNTTAMRDE